MDKEVNRNIATIAYQKLLLNGPVNSDTHHLNKPILRTATPLTPLISSLESKTAHAPRCPNVPDWQLSAKVQSAGSRTALASSSSFNQAPVRRRSEEFKAADGTPAPKEYVAMLTDLTAAINSGKLKKVRALFRQAAFCKFGPMWKYLNSSILRIPVEKKNYKLVELILINLKNYAFWIINGPTRGGEFSLLNAAHANDDSAMGLLLFKYGALPGKGCSQLFINRLLAYAVELRDTALVEKLMCYGDPELVRDFPERNSDGIIYKINPHKAIEFHLTNGNKEALTTIFSLGIHPFGPFKSSRIFRSLLEEAADWRHLKRLNLLIASKPEQMKSLKPPKGLEDIMRAAAINGHAEVLKILLNYHPLARPARNDGTAFSRFLNFFDDNIGFSGRVLDRQDQQGDTLLHLAVRSGDVATTTVLLDRGANGKKIIEEENRKLTSSAPPQSTNSLPVWTVDFLAMKCAERDAESSQAPQVVKLSLARIANDVAAMEIALSGHVAGPTPAQSTMVRAGIFAQSDVPGFLTELKPYARSGWDDATVGALNRQLASWSGQRVAEGEALEAPFRELVSDLWGFVCSRDVNDVHVGKKLKIDLVENGMYGLLADCVVAALTAASSKHAMLLLQDSWDKSFANALRREIWLDPYRISQRYSAAETSPNPVQFNVLLHRQLHAIEQYCNAF
jgi:hypothetical protein